MVDQLLVSLVLAPAAGVVTSRILVDRLPPRVAVLGFTAAAVLFALASAASLLAFGMPAAAGLIGFAPDLRAVARSWQIAVAPLWASWMCLALGAAVITSVAVTGRRQYDSLRAARTEAAALPGTGEVVVIPDGRPDAFALPGAPGRIVVTEGMLTALGDGRHQALLAHERAHLAGRHHRFAFTARLAAAALPALRPMVTLIDYVIERWADEQAAQEVGDRRSVAHVVGTAALAATEQADRHSAAAGTGSSRIGRRVPSTLQRIVRGPGWPGEPCHDLVRGERARHAQSAPHAQPAPPARHSKRRGLARSRRQRAEAVPPAMLRAGAPGRGPRPGPVPRRIAALLDAPLRGNHGLLLVALPAALAAASCGVAVEALLDLPYRRVFAIAES
ncbi:MULTISPECIES: M48 family metalloprotease [unclassified Parafrankia]|uniref:M48 family metalloprotease n=1 Tax=unclassified Parafrankia TaxID=2994368 RepID=UPI000DA546F1|nr:MULTISPECIES: M48 family metalloprotease [unclassified Parafrankia]TCJ40448.1 peptidase M48 [Parafrankia sp. BMG5.11]SQE00573.1 Peptidase M48 Ste24p [Parafrankia sp. Ea1.12]